MIEVKKQPLKRKGSSHVSPEQRKKQLIDAAVQCFTQKGYHGTTMDDIAKSSETSKGTLYRFFTSKDDLLLSIMDSWDERVTERLSNIEMTPIEKLKDYWFACLSEMMEFNGMAHAWFEFSRKAVAKERISQLYIIERNKIINLLEQIQQEGYLKGLSLVVVADIIISMSDGSMFISEVDDSFDLEARSTEIWITFEQMLLST